MSKANPEFIFFSNSFMLEQLEATGNLNAMIQ